MRRPPIVLERSSLHSSGCREWQGPLLNGYGKVHGRWLAHRLSYEQNVGPIPPGMCVCHHCDNPPCIEPTHLFLGTHADNRADSVAKGREFRKVLPEHHPAIVERLRAGERQKDIAASFSVNRNQIRRIAEAYGWKYRGSTVCQYHDVPKRTTRSGRSYCHVCVTERARRRRLLQRTEAA